MFGKGKAASSSCILPRGLPRRLQMHQLNNRQTLGGSRTAGPLKAPPLKSDSTKTTLKKMRGYGGKLFYDK